MENKKQKTFRDYLKGKEVEIVPWAHSIDSLSHELVVKYVKTLPKNSFLALELSSNDLIELEKELVGPNAVNLLSPKYRDDFRHKKMSAAFLEILFECKTRNINVIPINSNIRKSQALKRTHALLGNAQIIIGNVQTLTDLKNRQAPTLRFVAEADKMLSENIISALKKINLNKLVVLTGVNHSAGVQRNLSDKGVKTNIVTKIFSGATLKQNNYRIDLLRKAALALKKNNYALLNKLESQLTSADSMMYTKNSSQKRALSPEELIAKLDIKIKSHKQISSQKISFRALTRRKKKNIKPKRRLRK